MGLKSLLSDLESFDKNDNSMDAFGFHDTPASSGGFNYGESISIFDYGDAGGNQYFPFKQRSLGYGDGRNGTPGQGADISMGVFGRNDSPEPFRKQKLPKLTDEMGSGVWDVVDGVTDSFIRGGLITATKRSLTDAARIGEYLLSANGLAFIAKNVGLQRTNPKLQEGAGILGRNRLYNLGINTVAQTLVNFTGLHITRQGLLPMGKANYHVEQGYRVDTEYNETKYEYNVRGDFEDVEGGTGNFTDKKDVYEGNRLASLYNKLLNPVDTNEMAGAGYGDPRTLTTWTNPGDRAWAPYDDELYEFSGGPHSVYGIGKTRLKRYYSTNEEVLLYNPGSDQFNKLDLVPYYKSRHMGGIHGGEEEGVGKDQKPQTAMSPIVDFRKLKKGSAHSNYTKKNSSGQNLYASYGYPGAAPQMNAGPGINSTMGMFPQVPITSNGEINIKAPNLYKDQINNLDLIYHKGNLDSNKMPNGKPFPKDFIKFRIEAVDTDRPANSQTMVFRAFLDSMNDDYKADWNEYNYNGRSESFFTYAKFNRGVSFKFRVAAFSREEMRPLYRKLNYLVSTTAGEYKKTRLRGNFIRLTIGDYFARIPGFFTNISLSWQKDYPWEIALNQNGMDEDMNELPHVLDVSCQYQPVHDFTPQKGHDSPFILPTKYTNPNITPEQEWTRELPLYLDEKKAKSDIGWYESRDRGYRNRLQPAIADESPYADMTLEEMAEDSKIKAEEAKVVHETHLGWAAQSAKDNGAPEEVWNSGNTEIITQWLKNNP